MRASLGAAWYPSDTDNLQDLIKFADFAMYQVKNSTKGGIEDFDRKSYERDAFLMQSQEELNLLIDHRMVDYAFQPVVDARTGEVFGYEALMRPRTETIRTPLDVLRIARVHSKMGEIERLTWFECIKVYSQHPEWFGNRKIFINSISNQKLSPQDLQQFQKQFSKNLSHIVIEMTEGDQMDMECLREKQKSCRETGAAIALDDYGSGYNGDTMLLVISPIMSKSIWESSVGLTGIRTGRSCSVICLPIRGREKSKWWQKGLKHGKRWKRCLPLELIIFRATISASRSGFLNRRIPKQRQRCWKQ